MRHECCVSLTWQLNALTYNQINSIPLHGIVMRIPVTIQGIQFYLLFGLSRVLSVEELLGMRVACSSAIYRCEEDERGRNGESNKTLYLLIDATCWSGRTYLQDKRF